MNDVFQTLLTAGANTQKANQVGEWGLQWAALNGSVAIVVLLLAAGADPNFRNRGGYAPLYYAILNAQEACYEALLCAGADATVVDGNGLDAVTFLRKIRGVQGKNSDAGNLQRGMEEGQLKGAVSSESTTPSERRVESSDDATPSA